MKIGFSIDSSIDVSQETGLKKPIKIFKKNEYDELFFISHFGTTNGRKVKFMKLLEFVVDVH